MLSVNWPSPKDFWPLPISLAVLPSTVPKLTETPGERESLSEKIIPEPGINKLQTSDDL
jgi:hypothetical protein